MRVLPLALLSLIAAAGAAAQQPVRPAPPPPPAASPRGCVVVIDSVGREGTFVQLPNGQYQVYAGGGVFGRCRDQSTTMTCDSMAWFSERGELRLVGRVHFRDSTSLLDADRVTYWVRQERLVADGNVYTQNLRTRSDLRGPNLEYFRAAPAVRDTAELYATGRPTIHFYPARDTGRAGDTLQAFVVVADRVRMRGNHQMEGTGRVTVDRHDLAARSDSAELDLSRNVGALRGRPEVSGTGSDAYRLTGERIGFELTEEHELRRVLAAGSADAQGRDWRLRADTLDLAIDSGAVQRAQAWGRGARPHASSGLSTIVADSLDIRMPEQLVRTVWAYGRGRATSKPDSTAPADDWLTGDTLRAEFEVRDSSGARRSELERLAAFGSARAYYHVESEQQPQGPRGVNYARGRRISIAMRASKVATVDIVGQVDGIYLEPAPTLPAADSLRADTVTARPRAGGTAPAPPNPRTP